MTSPGGFGHPSMLLGAPIVRHVLAVALFSAIHDVSARQTESVFRWQHGLKAAAGDLPEAIALEAQPQFDVRHYQYATLPNGIQVFNVHDEQTLSAGFAVAVDTGLFNDPKKFPGLAHFCEHMLFLGSEKYPTPDGFDDFLGMYGGYSNAYTANEVTVYYAEVGQSGVEEGMMRFADLVRAPTFNSDYVEKEVHAIDSEHQKNVQDPYDRVFNLMYSLGNHESPVATFHTGSFSTLYTEPMAEGLNPVDALKVYFKRRYCANKMHVATYGPDSLKEQLARVTKAFGQMPAGDDECSKTPASNFSDVLPFPPSRLGKLATVIGTLPQAQLWIHFPLGDYSSQRKGQPLDVVDHLLTHGHPGSLKDVLMERLGLITDLWTSFDPTSAGTQLLVVFELTKQGQSHYGIVMDILFAYIASIRRQGVQKAFYMSLAQVRELNWNLDAVAGEYYYASPSDVAAGFAEKMTRLPQEELLTGDSLMTEAKLNVTTEIIHALTPYDMNLGFVVPPGCQAAKTVLEGKKARVMPNYNVKYRLDKIADKFPTRQQTWSVWLSTATEEKLEANLQARVKAAQTLQVASDDEGSTTLLPVTPRPYQNIPKDIDLSNMNAEEGHGDAKRFGTAPVDLRFDNSVFQLRRQDRGPDSVPLDVTYAQYRPGWVTSSPFAQVHIIFRVKEDLNAKPQPAAKTETQAVLFDKLLSRQLAPQMANLGMLGVSYSLVLSPTDLTITLSGLQESLSEAILTVLAQFKRLCVTAQTGNKGLQLRLKRVREQLEKELVAYSDMPVQYARSDRDLLLTQGSISEEEMRNALRSSNATVQDIIAEIGNSLFSKPLAVTSLAMGNIEENEAKFVISSSMTGIRKVADLVGTPIDSKASRGLAVREVLPVIRPKKPVEVRKSNPRPDDPNDVVVLTFLRGVANIESKVLLGILGELIDTMAFEELRTQQQLGYVVSAGSGSISNVYYISCTVQGTALRADEVEASMERFFQEQVPEALEAMSDEDFQQYKEAYEDDLLEPPRHYSEEMDHYWNSALLSGRCENKTSAMVTYLRHRLKSKSQLIEAWRDLIAPSNNTVRRKVVVKFFAGDVPPRPSLEEAEAIWKGQKVSEVALARLRHEYHKTDVFDSAQSDSQRQLEKTGSGVFSSALHCWD